LSTELTQAPSSDRLSQRRCLALQQTEIKTFGSAAFWTTTQLLTDSSQIKNPISGGGRILDIFMEIYAITVIAGLADAIGTFLQKRGEETKDKR
jgi:hypothetical protein